MSGKYTKIQLTCEITLQASTQIGIKTCCTNEQNVKFDLRVALHEKVTGPITSAVYLLFENGQFACLIRNGLCTHLTIWPDCGTREKPLECPKYKMKTSRYLLTGKSVQVLFLV